MVEASSVDVVAREARITVRFTADTVDEAIGVAEHTVERRRTARPDRHVAAHRSASAAAGSARLSVTGASRGGGQGGSR